MEYFGYFSALFIGITLGLTGGGGSILTVPILVYIMGYSPILGTAYSLFIVGITSAFATAYNFKKGVVDTKTAFLFATPSLIAVFITRKFILPAIPEVLIQNNYSTISKNTFLMVLFAIVMLLASISMLRKKGINELTIIKEKNKFLVIIQIAMVGVLTGLVGAGGGFLIIPALIFIAKLPMKKAIGTSLLIIAINSLIGFTGDISNMIIDWLFLIKFSSITIIGVFTGIHLSKYVNDQQLKKGFGWFVLVMAIFIFTKEIFF